MVAKFVDVKKSKHLLKRGFALFQTSSILFTFIYLSNAGEIFWFEFGRAVSKFRKRTRKFLTFAHLLDKAGE